MNTIKLLKAASKGKIKSYDAFINREGEEIIWNGETFLSNEDIKLNDKWKFSRNVYSL